MVAADVASRRQFPQVADELFAYGIDADDPVAQLAVWLFATRHDNASVSTPTFLPYATDVES